MASREPSAAPAHDELVERLRRNAEFQEKKGWGNNGLLHTAADEIEALVAERDRYREALRSIRDHATDRDREIPMSGVIRACNEALGDD